MDVSGNNMPSLKDMALNLASTAKDVIKDAVTKGVITVPDTTAKSRWEVCNNCEHLLHDVSSSTFRCKLCGCNMKLKINFAASSCPINKWSKV